MKSRAEIVAIQECIERCVFDDNRGPLIMALEWVLNEGISTSCGLEEWLEEEGHKK